VIARAGKPVARLVAASSRPVRRPGTWRGRLIIADDFDDSPASMLEAFHGEGIDPVPR